MFNASTTLTLQTVRTISILNTTWIIMEKMLTKQSHIPFAIQLIPPKLEFHTTLHMTVSIILFAIGTQLIATVNIKFVRTAQLLI